MKLGDIGKEGGIERKGWGERQSQLIPIFFFKDRYQNEPIKYNIEWGNRPFNLSSPASRNSGIICLGSQRNTILYTSLKC